MGYSHLSNEKLRRRIKELEAKGYTGKTNSVLHALNCEQTNRLSDKELLSLLRSRAAAGKSIGKLAAAARRRGLSF
jgi:chorismate mutase